MKKNKSLIQLTHIYELYFAVCPLSINFHKSFEEEFMLFFEKDLQIIGKVEVPAKVINKEQLISFEAEKNIVCFRIQSQSKLDYSWSLYAIKKFDEGENIEEFKDSHKISIKQFWNTYQVIKQQAVHEESINFNTIKSKFNFKFFVAESSFNLIQLIKKQLETTSSLIQLNSVVNPVEFKNPEEKTNRQEVKVEKQLDEIKEQENQKYEQNIKQEVITEQQIEGISLEGVGKKQSVILKQDNQIQMQTPQRASSKIYVPGSGSSPFFISTSEIKLAEALADDINKVQEKLQEVKQAQEQIKEDQESKRNKQLQEAIEEFKIEGEEEKATSVKMTSSITLGEDGKELIVAEPFLQKIQKIIATGTIIEKLQKLQGNKKLLVILGVILFLLISVPFLWSSDEKPITKQKAKKKSKSKKASIK